MPAGATLGAMAGMESTVWMVHGGTPRDGIRGTLTLEDGAVVFRPRYGLPGSETVFGPGTIRGARRVLGSPVLELRPRGEGLPKVVGFYFVQPPSLEGQDDARFGGRHRARRQAAMTLVQWNSVKKDEVGRWVRAIKEARAEG
jgi:hypothetical protein